MNVHYTNLFSLMKGIHMSNISIGSKLKQFRKQRGLSQKALSEITQLSNSFISQIENGKYKSVGSTSLLALSKALNIKIQDLFSEEAA